MSQRRLRRSRGRALSLALDLVWCPRYWRQTLGGNVADEVTEQTADEDRCQIVTKEIMPDQVHLFTGVGLSIVPVSLRQAFKGRTAQIARHEFLQPRNHAKMLWSPSYLATSVAYVRRPTKRCAANQSDAAAAS